jgi:hypothetical protein
MLSASTMMAFWRIAIILKATLVAVLVARRMWRRFPVFMTYASVSLSVSILLFALRGTPQIYIYVYWCGELAAVILSFSAVYEIFRDLLGSCPALNRVASFLFCGFLVTFVVLGCLVIYVKFPHAQSDVTASLLIVEEAIRLVEVGLLVFLLLFATAFGLHWRKSLFGIAVGLALYAVVELTGEAMATQFGVSIGPVFSVVRILAVNCSLLLWIGYMLVPERVTNAGELPKPAQLEQWNQVIMELINQ